jgi:subtilisin family serine protease
VDRIKRFSTIPHIAIHVDSAALTALVAIPEVEIVLADVPMAPFLGASGATVGADNVQNAYGSANTGAGQATAILDTGVEAGHDFLGGRIVSQACYSTDDDLSDSLCPGGVEETVDPNSGVQRHNVM